MANFTGQAISASYQRVLQIDGNIIQDGFGVSIDDAIIGSLTGSFSGSLEGIASTASYVETAQTASYVETAQTASYIGNAQTASYVETAQTASYVETSQTASYVENAQTASYVETAQTASYVENAQTASYVENAQTSSYVENAQTASYVENAQTASYVENAQSASYINASNIDGTVLSSSYALNADTLDGYDSSIFATTGSNIFVGNQEISGALQLNPTEDPGTLNISASYFFVSSSADHEEFNLQYRNNGALWETHWLEERTDTGLTWGGVVTYSGSTIYVSPGAGILVNHNANTSSHGDTQPTYLPFGPITSSATYITSSQLTYLLIDSDGSLLQQTVPFTPDQFNEKLPLGYITHLNTSSINSYADARTTTYGQDEQQTQFIRAFGPLKLNGFDISPQSGSLKISVASGRTYRFGGFYSQDPQNPSIYDSPNTPTGSIVRLYRDPSAVGGFRAELNGNLPFTDIDPTKWDDGSGTLQSLGNNDWTIQRAFQGAINGVTYIYYGQNVYDNLNAAIQSISTETFEESTATQIALPFIGYIITKGSTTNLTDISDAKLINSGLFRNTAGSSGGGGVATTVLNDLSDVNIVTPTTGEALVYNAGLWENGTPLNTISSSYSSTSSYVENAQTASYVQNAQTASYIQNAQTASYVQNAQTASYVLNAVSASYVATASGIQGPAQYIPYWTGTSPAQSNTLSNSSIFQDSTGNILIGASGAVGSKLYIGNNIAGQGGIQIVSSAGATNSFAITHLGTNSKFIALTNSASSEVFSISTLGRASLTGSLSVFGSITGSAGIINPLTASYAITSSYVENAQTASYVLNAVSSSFATSSSRAVSSSFASTASYTPNAVVTASITSNTITFTKGDGSTFPITVSTGSSATSTYYSSNASVAGTATGSNAGIIYTPSIITTPSAGTYLVTATVDTGNPSTTGTWIEISIYNGSTEQTETIVRTQNVANQTQRASIATHKILTVNGLTDVSFGLRTSANVNAWTIQRFVLTLVKIA